MGDEVLRRRPSVGIHISEQRQPAGKGAELPRQSLHHINGENTKEQTKTATKEWRKIPDMKSRPGRQNEAGEATAFTYRPGRQLGVLQASNQVTAAKYPVNITRQLRGQLVFMIRSETAMADREALISTGGVVSKANVNPKIKDYIDALRKMSISYSTWNWNPIPINSSILFKFPSEAALNILTKRDVIPCNNGHFVVTKWNEEREGVTHNFPIKMVVLAFSLPLYLRTEPDLARMVANFAHLIEATQVMEKGGPMKLILGYWRRTDVPKEILSSLGRKSTE